MISALAICGASDVVVTGVVFVCGMDSAFVDSMRATLDLHGARLALVGGAIVALVQWSTSTLQYSSLI